LSFASTTFILSLYNVNARHVVSPNVVVGMAVFCGGLAQLLAGMWEFPRGNMFAATGTRQTWFPHRQYDLWSEILVCCLPIVATQDK
jgi:hypothetical protein